MQEVVYDIFAQLRSAWRFRWLGVGASWAIAISGWGWVALQADIYEANTRILIDTSSVLTPLLSDQVVLSDPAARLIQARQALLSRANLEEVALTNNLDALAVSENERELVLINLAETVAISATPASQRGGIEAADSGYIFEIAYRHGDRNTAVGVVTSFKDILIERVLASNRESSAVASDYLEREIAVNRELLDQAEGRRLDFLRSNSDRLPSSGVGIQERLQRESDALDEARRERRLAESTRVELQAQLDGAARLRSGQDVFGSGAPPPGSLDAQIRDARSELNRLLRTYTEAHPAVKDARTLVEGLEADRAEELQQLGILDPNQELSSLEVNPAYEGLSSELTATDVAIARLDADIADRTRRVAELQSQIEDVLGVEAELENLDRDVEKYDGERIRLEEARQRQQTTQQVSETDQLDFQVTDPPRAGIEPVAPMRLYLIFGVFFSALGVGGGLCWLLAQLRPVFGSSRVLRDASGLPIFGTVGRVATSSRVVARRHFSLMAFAFSMIGLAGVFGSVTLIEVAGPGLRTILGVD